MSAAFDAAFLIVLGVEGDYSDDTNDPGNWTGGKVGAGEMKGTKYGISAASFPYLDIKALTVDQAKAIYQTHYWVPIRGDDLPKRVGLIMFDCAVNQGVHAAISFLQQSVGTTVDGIIGPATLARTLSLQETLPIELSARRAVAYARGDMATYGLGWMRRLFKVAFTAEAA